MTAPFLTLEDINGALYREQGFYWVEIDTGLLGTTNFTNGKLDFCTISRTLTGGRYKFTFVIDNPFWIHLYCPLTGARRYFTPYNTGGSGDTLVITSEYKRIILILGIGLIPYSGRFGTSRLYAGEPLLNLNYKELNTPQSLKINQYYSNKDMEVVYEDFTLEQGYCELKNGASKYGYVLVNLVKSDFQFNCSQSLVTGRVNKVQLGTDSDYKPSGDMIGDNTPTITVQYKDKTIPVTWDSTLNDYVFNLDLSDKTNESNVRFKVIVEENDVINATSTDVSLSSVYPTINNLSALTSLCSNGGVGRIGSNITLTSDLTLSNDVYLIGNEKTLTMASHKIIIPSERTFKASNTIFTGGENTIQQNKNSKVELTDCTFTNCTGLGSVIDCQVDIGSLDNATDFTTIITNCTFTNNDMCILHGGELTINNCEVNGKISDKDNPYFIYQTDGHATITKTRFSLTKDTQIATDIGFNSCIFTIGETAVINGRTHTDWQNKDITEFLDNNSSVIDLTYLYEPISDYITLSSNNGYCHSASGVDFVFKTNVLIERED